MRQLIAEQRRAKEEQASQQALKTIQRALHEAILALPPEEYDWFDIKSRTRHGAGGSGSVGEAAEPDGAEAETGVGIAEPAAPAQAQRQFFDLRDRCSRSSYRRRRAPCRSTNRANPARCRAPVRGAA